MTMQRSAEETELALSYLQRSGKILLGCYMWNGKVDMRIGIESWRTNETDIEMTIALFRLGKEASNLKHPR